MNEVFMTSQKESSMIQKIFARSIPATMAAYAGHTFVTFNTVPSAVVFVFAVFITAMVFVNDFKGEKNDEGC